MQLIDEEHVLEIVNKDGVLCYMCEECEDTSFVGLYVNQPDEVVEQVWEGKVEPDELEHEYVYDWDYAIYYHSGNSRLY